MELVLLIADMFAVVVIGGWAVKYMDQKARDKGYRRTYIITFPSPGVPAQQMGNFIRAVHGQLSNPNPLVGSHTLVFELWGSGGTKVPRLKVPAHLVEDIHTQLHAAIPGLKMDVEEDAPRRVWTWNQELALSNKRRGLDPSETPESASRRLTTTFNTVADSETLMLQWVITAAGRQELPIQKEAPKSKFSIAGAINGGLANKDEVNDRRTKLSEPNIRAALRIAAVADTEERAVKLVNRVRNALAPTGTAYTYFKRRRWLSAKTRQHRLDTAAGSTSWPVQLSISEFVKISGWQVDGPPGVGFAPGRSMDLPPVAGVARDGIIVGKATYPGQERPVAISYDASSMHVQILGRTGMGKSVFMGHSARQIMEAGHGLIVMEKSGDLINKILDYVPPERFEDVIVWDMNDTDRPIGFNFLDQGNRDEAIGGIIGLLAHRFNEKGSMGPWVREGLKLGLQTIADTPGLSIIDLPTLLNPRTDEDIAWAESVRDAIKDPELQQQWINRSSMKDHEQAKRAEPVETRMQEFLARGIRNIIGQSKSAFTWQDVLEGRKILLVSFKGAEKDAVGLMCGLAMESLWREIKRLGDAGVLSGVAGKTFVMLDESKEFMDLPIDLEAMFEQARKHDISLWIANQQLSQLQPRSLEEAVGNNTLTKVVFRTFARDALTLRRETNVNEENFKLLPKGEAILHTITESGGVASVTVRTTAWDAVRPHGNAQDLRRQSSMLYGTPKAKVQAEIERRRRAPGREDQQQRPPGSKPERGEGWV